jgi:hypothetical protein
LSSSDKFIIATLVGVVMVVIEPVVAYTETKISRITHKTSWHTLLGLFQLFWKNLPLA